MTTREISLSIDVLKLDRSQFPAIIATPANSQFVFLSSSYSLHILIPISLSFFCRLMTQL